MLSREGGKEVTVFTGLDDQVYDLISCIPDVALSYMVRWKKRKSTCQKDKRLVRFTNPLLSRIRPKLVVKIILLKILFKTSKLALPISQLTM